MKSSSEKGMKESVAVVTGAAAGIGRALALEAASRGALVVAADLTPPDSTVDAIRSVGGLAHGMTVDIADAGAVDNLAAECAERFGKVNLLCANAGIGLPGTFEETTPEQFARVIGINVLGTFYCLRAFVAALRSAAEHGELAAILITGSEHSLGVPESMAQTAYTTSKHALIGLADSARRDLADTDISVSLLCPSWTLTEALEGFLKLNPEAAASLEPITQTPGHVAGLGLDAVAAGRFLTITNEVIRPVIERRADDLAAGLAAMI